MCVACFYDDGDVPGDISPRHLRRRSGAGVMSATIEETSAAWEAGVAGKSLYYEVSGGRKPMNLP